MTKQDAIDLFGGIPALADALGITQQAVYQWDDAAIPALRRMEIQEILRNRPADELAAVAE